MSDAPENLNWQTRRQFLTGGKSLLGGAALAWLNAHSARGALSPDRSLVTPHFPPRAKQVIYLHMVGGPSQMDLFDYKPAMKDWFDKDLPESIRKGQRLTTMTSGQSRFPVAPTMYDFHQTGECGMWMNKDLLPWLAQKSDEICWMRSLHTEAINHEPAIAAMQTGNQVAGRPCLGSWASYGLGALNKNLPAFVVLVAIPSNRDQEQAISSRLWGSGYLSGEHAGVSFRSKGDPILYINNPPGVPNDIRRRSIEGINALNQINYQNLGDPNTHTRIQQYEMAFRMQASVPELTDFAKRTGVTPFNLYGDEAKKPGSFANSPDGTPDGRTRCRFVQIYHNNGTTTGTSRNSCPASARTSTSPPLRPARRPQATRHARRHAGHVGAASSAARSTARASWHATTTAATTIRAASRCGWPAAARRAEPSTARPTISPTTSPKTQCTSATSTPPSCNYSATTTSVSLTATKASTNASPAWSPRT